MKDVKNWLNWQKGFLISVIILITSCSYLPNNKATIEFREYKLDSYTYLLPNEYRYMLDSNKYEDYIDKKITPYRPSILDINELYNPNAIHFDPYYNDSGIVLSERDMALYIRDRALLEFLIVENDMRRLVHKELVFGIYEGENLYRETIQEANEYTKTIHDAYLNEKKSKETWRNITLFVIIFSSGFLLSELVNE